jgi:hypothetical protein
VLGKSFAGGRLPESSDHDGGIECSPGLRVPGHRFVDSQS